MSAIIERLKVKNPPKSKKDIIIQLRKPKGVSLDKATDDMSKTDSKTDKKSTLDIIQDVIKGTILGDDTPSPATTTTTTTDAPKPEQKPRLSIIDKTDVGYDRAELKRRMRARGLIVPTTDKIPTQTISKKVLPVSVSDKTKPKTSMRKIRKIPKLRIIDDDDVDSEDVTKQVINDNIKEIKELSRIPSKTVTKRTRTIQRPKLKIIDEAPATMVDFSSEITSLRERLPTKKKEEIIAPSYYMNNREKFVEFVNKLFYPYKEKIDADEADQSVSCETRSGGDFDIMVHQKIVRDYLNIHSPYRGLLLYHGLGSGKTCTSIAIAEGLKDDKQIVVMTPASLRANYISQLKFCGDLIFKKDQHWEFLSTQDDRDNKLTKSIAELLHLPEKYIAKQRGAWFVNVKKPSNYEELTTDDRKILDSQLNEMISVKYRFINYNGLRSSSVDTLSQDGRINPFDNKVVIIDEAHNFISRIVNKLKKTDSISMRLYEFLLKANNCKVILLSGTPIINYPNEIAIMFNILRGYIQSWTIPLNIKTGRKISEESIRAMFSKYAFIDYLEYSPSSKKLTVTKNPFGFINRITKTGDYKGVKYDKRGDTSDAKFIDYVIKTLRKNEIEVIGTKFDITLNKALPDTLETFKNYFIKPDGSMQNINLFKRRILGLSSYFRSAQEQLMPEFDMNKNYHVLKLPMSDYQFGVYESARQAERTQETNNAKKAKKATGTDLYENSSSTYRIFSRAFCNFVFPPEMKRPMPREEDTLDEMLNNKLDEDLLDKKGVYEMLDNPDGRYTMDDLDKLSVAESKNKDVSYDKRIEDALEFLKDNEGEYLVPDKLETFSPKFLQLLDTIQTTDEKEESKGLHLIYSQFRTLEGVGIIKLVLEANGYAQFKIKQNPSTRKWEIDIAEENRGRPTFALYTGTETPEEKEIIRNIFNSTWKDVPSEIVGELQRSSLNNNYGEIIKIIMITASGAEGINLRNVRHVHLIEPYWHPVRTEQVIGRARRICSHMDLLPEQRKVDVYMYLMTFTDDQKTSDKSIELRLKDLSKIDKTTPLTSDEALYEISRIKEDINRQLLTSVKETSIDCTLHSKSNNKEGLYCFSFGDVDPSLLSYTYSYQNEQTDKTGDVNKKEINWKAQSFTLNGKKYMLRLKADGKTRTDRVYDYDTFQQAKKSMEVNPQFIGILVFEKDASGKKKAVIRSDD